MVSWGWLPICFMGGAVFGILLISWLIIGDEKDGDK